MKYIGHTKYWTSMKPKVNLQDNKTSRIVWECWVCKNTVILFSLPRIYPLYFLCLASELELYDRFCELWCLYWKYVAFTGLGVRRGNQCIEHAWKNILSYIYDEPKCKTKLSWTELKWTCSHAGSVYKSRCPSLSVSNYVSFPHPDRRQQNANHSI